MLSYRLRKSMHRLLITVLVLILLAVGAVLCWLLWLNRYVVYTRDGVKLDFSLSMQFPEGQPAVPPTTTPPVDIFYNDEEDVLPPVSTELQQLSGVYVTRKMLESGIPALQEQLLQLPTGTTVMLEVKNNKGEFFYSSGMGRSYGSIVTEEMNNLIATLSRKGYHVVAHMPGLRDYWYFLEDQRTRVPYGLAWIGHGGALWIDYSGPSYWFNPLSPGTFDYLVQVITELKTLGFDEVVFHNFLVPDTDQIIWNGDKEAAIRDLADLVVRSCATETFTVSFAADASFPLPEGRCRLYLSNVDAAELYLVEQQVGVADPHLRLVFLTDRLDTRFDEYGVLRPLQAEA